MSGLPKLPGLTFSDPTLSRYHLPHTFDYCNGYKIPKPGTIGVGGRELDVNSVALIQKYDPVRYDPSLTYGRTRSTALPQYLPHFALYDQKCLTFKAFFKQSVFESPLEFYRVRYVNIIYFLEDDSITVIEPRVVNSGLDQGRLVRRGKIPKFESGEYWHWKDLAIGKDIALNGIVYHTVDCDLFTREFMWSQGLMMGDAEAMPPDPYTQDRANMVQLHQTQTPPADDKLRRFLEYDGKVLKFNAVWDDRDAEYGELKPCTILYFLADDTVAVKENYERNSGRDPFPLLLRKTKLPKVWTDRPVTYPSVYMELSDAEVTEYYQPKDFIIGETIFVLGRKMLLVDCDPFTRNFYKKAYCIEQKAPIEYKEKPKPPPERKMPPHDGLGSLEDSLQNTLTVLPKPPKKDVIRQILNANKYLRYEMKMVEVHPEDTIRRFLLVYSLSEGTCLIHEPPIRNSGILGGKYLKHTLIIKPGSDPLNPCYYTPVDFCIGAVLIVFEQRFKIIGADLYVYRYMQANPEKFPSHVVENIRNYMYNKGYLKGDIEYTMEIGKEAEKKARRDAIGKEIQVVESELDKCMRELKAGGGADPEYSEAKNRERVQQYEDSLIPTYVVPPHGILPVSRECRYPIHIGKVKTTECPEGEEGDGSSFTPKHVDTPEEIRQKYYAGVLKQHHEICEHGKAVECVKHPLATDPVYEAKAPTGPDPLIVSAIEYPKGVCKTKSVRFADGVDKCLRDKYDLCDLKTDKIHCDCTQYQKQC